MSIDCCMHHRIHSPQSLYTYQWIVTDARIFRCIGCKIGIHPLSLSLARSLSPSLSVSLSRHVSFSCSLLWSERALAVFLYKDKISHLWHVFAHSYGCMRVYVCVHLGFRGAKLLGARLSVVSLVYYVLSNMSIRERLSSPKGRWNA